MQNNTFADQTMHPLVGKRIEAIWMPGKLLESKFAGEVVDAVPVSYSQSYRLVVRLDGFPNGQTMRCYTADRNWQINPLSIASA